MGDHTQFGWLQRAAVILSVLLTFLCMQFFGTFSTLVLCGLGGLTYCSVRFVCFVSEAWEWRTKLDRCYKKIFSSKQDSTNWKSQSGPNQANVPKSPNRVQVSKPSHKEAQKLIELIMQEFVLGWYGDITNDTEFPEDLEKVLEHVFLEVNVRLQKIDFEDTVCELLALVLTYLEALNEIGMIEYNGVSVFDVSNEKCLRAFESNPKLVHRALRSPDSELRYYRRAIDAVVQCAVPPEYRNCDIVCTFVRELLLKNIVVPLIDLLCDPDFLHMSIPIILSKASPEKIQRELKNIEKENEELRQRKSAQGLGSQRRRFMSASQFAQRVQYELPIGSSPHSAPLGDFADQATSGTTTSLLSIQPQQPEADIATALGTRPSPSSPIPCPKHYPTHASLPPTQAHSVAPASPLQYEFTPPCDVSDDLLYIDLAPIYVTRHVRVDGGGPGNSYIGYIFKVCSCVVYWEEMLEAFLFPTHLLFSPFSPSSLLPFFPSSLFPFPFLPFTLYSLLSLFPSPLIPFTLYSLLPFFPSLLIPFTPYSLPLSLLLLLPSSLFLPLPPPSIPLPSLSSQSACYRSQTSRILMSMKVTPT